MAIKETSPTVAQMIANIMRFFEQATPDQVFDGMHWYDSAQILSRDLAQQHGLSVDVVACVFAAHSMNASWKANELRARKHLAGTPSGLSAAITMANNAIAHPDDPFPYIVGPKINPFARCIAGDLTAVATDRWAQRAAFDTRDDRLMARWIKRKGVRNSMIEAYTKAAADVGIQPAELQAIVWVVVRGAAE